MLSNKTFGVGLCVWLLTQPFAVAQTPFAYPAEAQQTVLPDPLEFVVLNAAELLEIQPDRMRLQLEYARQKGFVQYSLGSDFHIRDELVRRLTQAYGLPSLNANSHYEWQVENPDPYSHHRQTLTINLGAKMQHGYFVKVEGRVNRRVVVEPEPQRTAPIISGYKKPKGLKGEVD